MTTTIPSSHGDLTVWTTADPQSLPAASAAMMTSVANALNKVLGNYTTAALLLAASPTSAGYYTASDAPGGFFYWSGSAWTMTGVAVVASTAVITPAQAGWRIQVSGILYRYNGSAWKAWESDWVSYTPTVSGGNNLGSGSTVTAQYQYSQGRIRVKGRVTLGSTGLSIVGAIILTLPVTFATAVRYGMLGTERVYAFDVSTSSIYTFIARHEQSDYGKVNLAPWSGTAATAMNSTTPFTWAVGDTIDFDFIGDPA